jgi:site-specific DNA-methyltransferase (adenine-specific)
MKITENIEITNEDNMLLMARYPDNYFDLAIVDPPYGIGESGKKRENTTSDKWKAPTKKVHNVKEWDNQAPSQEYFNELKRVSKNQIIWGGNYFIDKIQTPSMGWIFWDKKNGDSDFSDGELAYTSFNKGLRKFEWLWNGFQKQRPEERIHPTQKPVALYEWILQKYAKCIECDGSGKVDSLSNNCDFQICKKCKAETFKIIDTHLGSGSIAIAVDKANKIDKMNLTLTACELEKDYFNNAMLRIKENTNWQSLF